MGLLVCMLLGMFTGWVVAALKEVDEGIFAKMGLGLIGGLLGGVVASLFSDSAAMGHVTLLGSIAGIVGAFALLGITSRLAGSTDSSAA